MIFQASLMDIAYVVDHAREEDLASIRAFYTGDLQQFAANRFSSSTAHWVMMHEGLPAAVGGIAEPIKGVAHGWFLSTPVAWPSFRCKRQILIAMRRAVSKIKDAGYHRIQAQCIESEGAVRLLEHLGFEFEGTLRAGGAGGENLLNYGRLA